jgi:ADP-heptose:LPS heptosyltransferase
MGSLGKWLRPSQESFEDKGGRYLKAQEGLGRRLRADLGVGAFEKLIGLSWRSASAETGAARSLSLKALVGALQGVEGVRFLNLQYGEVSEEIRALREETGVEVLTHPGIDNREDLEGLAGLIEGCDLVVSVGNATAHLSGALGQKTWVLLPYVAGWRWLHEGERCPWYQSVRLYRQSKPGDWAAPLSKIVNDLHGSGLHGMRLSPQSAQSLFEAAYASQLQGDLVSAEAAYEQILRSYATHQDTLNLLGAVRHAAGDYRRAGSLFNRAIVIAPGEAVFWANRGQLYMVTGRPDLAEGDSDRALVVDFRLADPATNAALCRFYRGRFAEGWELYDSRLRADFFWRPIPESRRVFNTRSLFTGPGSKRVLVWAEQGVGDEVMFGGLVREFRGLCGEVLLQVDRRLMGLFERALPGVRVFERGKTVPAELYDEQIPMGSLGKWLRPSQESFEDKGGRYLKAQEGLGRRLRADLGVGAFEKLIGLSWRSASAETGAARSLSLKALVGALQGVEGVRFLNLQYGEVSEEIRALREETGVEVLTHPGIDNREDLEGLAGLIEGCDLVVSVGNATAHLSGALGQKTWVLLPYVAGWRWLHEGERCPWYQSVRLYRQAERGEWNDTLLEVGNALRRCE